MVVKENALDTIKTATGAVGIKGVARPTGSIIAQRLAESKSKNADVSKVVDENGEPLVVYHATDGEFNEFNESDAGIYFGLDKEAVKDIGARGTRRTVAAFLLVRNMADAAEFDTFDNPTVADVLQRGADGVWFEDEDKTSIMVVSPAQIKSATDNTGAFDPANRDVRYSISGLYTGSAADYANMDENGNIVNGPSLRHIGSGEGTQVYGWGLYASNRRGVAEWYARADRRRKQRKHRIAQKVEVLFDGEPVNDTVLYEEHYSTMIDIEDRGSVDEAIKRWEFLANCGTLTKLGMKEFEWLKANRSRISVREVGNVSQHLYEQTFFTNRPEGDESHLLNWYEPVSKDNMERIRTQLAKEGVENAWLADDAENDFRAYKAEAVYKNLERTLGDAKAASEFLARAGIDGVKYPVDSFGGKGVKDGDKAGWNYVSFRDDNIRIDHKWTDGEQRYSVTTRAFNPEAQVAVVDGTQEPELGNLTTAEIRKWMRDKYAGMEVTIDADGTLVVFADEGMKAALKKRGKHRRTLHILDALVKNSRYTRFEPTDGQAKHKNLIGQFVYTAALRLSDGVYGVEIKLDIPASDPEKTHFKGQTLKTKIADALLSAQLRSEERLTPASVGDPSASVRLGDIAKQDNGTLPQTGGEVKGELPEGHGNSIYFFLRKSTSSRTSGLSADLYIIFFLLTRPYFAWFRHINAVFRRMFMFSGELSFLARDASSRKTTSRLQCSWLSMDQCLPDGICKFLQRRQRSYETPLFAMRLAALPHGRDDPPDTVQRTPERMPGHPADIRKQRILPLRSYWWNALLHFPVEAFVTDMVMPSKGNSPAINTSSASVAKPFFTSAHSGRFDVLISLQAATADFFAKAKLIVEMAFVKIKMRDIVNRSRSVASPIGETVARSFFKEGYRGIGCGFERLEMP